MRKVPYRSRPGCGFAHRLGALPPRTGGETPPEPAGVDARATGPYRSRPGCGFAHRPGALSPGTGGETPPEPAGVDACGTPPPQCVLQPKREVSGQ